MALVGVKIFGTLDNQKSSIHLALHLKLKYETNNNKLRGSSTI